MRCGERVVARARPVAGSWLGLVRSGSVNQSTWLGVETPGEQGTAADGGRPGGLSRYRPAIATAALIQPYLYL